MSIELVKDSPNLIRVSIGNGINRGSYQEYVEINGDLVAALKKAKQIEKAAQSLAKQTKIKRGHGTGINGIGIVCRYRNRDNPIDSALNMYVAVANSKSSIHHNPDYTTSPTFNILEFGYKSAWKKGCKKLAEIRKLDEVPQEWLDAIPDKVYLDLKISKFNAMYGSSFQNFKGLISLSKREALAKKEALELLAWEKQMKTGMPLFFAR